MYGLVDTHRDTHGVEPICKALQIAPSAYRRHAARRRNASMLSARAKRDKALQPRIERKRPTATVLRARVQRGALISSANSPSSHALPMAASRRTSS
jgi:hypothetical protein